MRRPGSGSVARTPETTSPASACATASSAARSSSSPSAMSPTIGGMPSVDAKELFAPLGPSYDRVGAALSFGQDPLWRRFLVSRLPRDGGHVLDVATGTGLVAAELVRRGFRVTGVDQSARDARAGTPEIRRRGRARRGLGGVAAVRRRELRPRHVHVPPALRRRPRRDARRARTRRAHRRNGCVARVRRSGRTRASGMGAVRPCRAPARRPRARRTAGARSATSSATRFARTGRRIRSSASSSSGSAAGIARGRGSALEPRRRSRHVGTARMSAPSARPSWYALDTGGWRDYVTLLHLPYTAWHLSYVVIGGCLAPIVAWNRLGAAVAAFGLAVGIGAHALDELSGRPLRTSIPSAVLTALAVVSIGAACAIGIVGAVAFEPWLALLGPCRPLPRRRLQPGAPGRPVPLGSLVRARLGRLPGRLRLCRRRRRSQRRSAARRRVCRSSLARPAHAVEPRALRAPTRRIGGRNGRARGRLA